jgi:hypothetical protein
VGLPPETETAIPLGLTPPPGRTDWTVLSFDVALGDLELREFAEALVAPGA